MSIPTKNPNFSGLRRNLGNPQAEKGSPAGIAAGGDWVIDGLWEISNGASS